MHYTTLIGPHWFQHQRTAALAHPLSHSACEPLERFLAALAIGAHIDDHLRPFLHLAADQQIERIEGKGTATRPNELERVDKIESDLLNAVAQIRDIPPENFLLADPTRDVNTPVEQPDE